MKRIKLFAMASVLGLITSCGEPKEVDPPMPVVTLKDTLKPTPIKDTAAAKDTIVTPPSGDEKNTQNASTDKPNN